MDQSTTEPDLFKTDSTSQPPAHDVDPQKPQAQAVSIPSPAISWTGSEFIGHRKTTTWYFALGLVAVLISVGIFFIAKDIFLTATIFIGMVTFGVYAGRSPRNVSYALDESGLGIGNRRYGYNEFRSFSTSQEGDLLRVEFAPHKRFAVYTTIYCKLEDADNIVKQISSHLPLTTPRDDFADQLMRRIGF